MKLRTVAIGMIWGALFGFSSACFANPPKVWIFKDYLVGAYHQRIGVARELTKDIEILEKLDPENLPSTDDFLNAQLGERQKNPAAWPDFILHTEPREKEIEFLLELRRISPKPLRVIYLENPQFHVGDLDMVVNPSRFPMLSGPNIFRTVGVGGQVSQETLKEARAQWGKKLSWLPKPLIHVAMGGEALHNPYHPEYAQDLGKRLKEAVRATGGSLLITTSRRTPPEVVSSLLREISGIPQFVFSWAKGNKDENPYVAGLAMADFVVVTGDSMSMLSEAVFTGKPLYVHSIKGAILPEHGRTIDELYLSGMARPLTGKKLQPFTYEAVDYNKVIADEIRRRFTCEGALSKRS